MDDKHVEDMIREQWSSEPPEGMKERVLRRSRQELALRTRRGRLTGLLRWKPLLAALAVLSIVGTGLSDHFRQERISAMTGIDPSVRAEWNADAVLEQRREMERFLAQTWDDGLAKMQRNGGETP